MHTIVLASSSMSRKKLLQRLQIAFTSISPEVDETPLPNELPDELAKRLAIKKAQAVKDHYPDALIIGADQVIICQGVLLEKPGTIDIARKQLTWVSGKSIDSYTGLCVFNAKTGQQQITVESYQVSFRPLTNAMIEAYLARDNPIDCAGSIRAESLGVALFTQMQGSDPNALLGLPLIKLTDMLLNEGIDLLATA